MLKLQISEVFAKDLTFKHFLEISKLAENWWETTHQDNLNDLEQIYQSSDFSKMRKALRQSLILENLLITIIYTLFSQMQDILNTH